MIMPKRRYIIISVAAILVIAIVLASFAYLNLQQPYAGKVESITFGSLPNETNSLVYIANDQKYFAANGFFVKPFSGLCAVPKSQWIAPSEMPSRSRRMTNRITADSL